MEWGSLEGSPLPSGVNSRWALVVPLDPQPDNLMIDASIRPCLGTQAHDVE